MIILLSVVICFGAYITLANIYEKGYHMHETDFVQIKKSHGTSGTALVKPRLFMNNETPCPRQSTTMFAN